jgi:hypothetical protein
VRALALAAVVATGCRYGGTFMCDRNDQCGAGGSCQAAHYCSFGDMDCVSGQRYDQTAGPYAGVCVGEENGIDAAIFDPATCPATYTITIASAPKSRYFMRTATTSYWMHHSACKADLAGATHLMLPDSAAEISEIVTATADMATTNNEVLVGVVQNIGLATAPNVGWTRFDGNSVDPSLWLPNEPNDGDGNEANHAENVGSINRTYSLMNDTVGTAAMAPAICECDGKALAPSIESILAGDPNHD